MSQQPHQAPGFQHAAEFTIAVTFVVAGGKRPRTAQDRGHRVLEQIANYTARLGQVAEVTAVGGPSRDGTIIWPTPVRFAAANGGHTSPSQPDKFDRYLDPERDRALRSLADADVAHRARRDADRRRRGAVGCRNTHRSVLLEPRDCRCVYCDPQAHLLALRAARRGHDAAVRQGCLCGQAVAAAAQRCRAHRDTELVVFDDDPAPLQLLADLMSTG